MSAGEIGDALLARFVQGFEQRPSASVGSWALWDLAWVARVREPGAPTRARFPGALTQLLDLRREDGGFGPPAPHPYDEMVRSLVIANTLITWEARGQGSYATRIRGALSRAAAAQRALERPPHGGGASPYGRLHNPMPALNVVLPALILRRTQELGAAYLGAEERRVFAPYLARAATAFELNPPLAELYANEFVHVHYGEYLPRRYFDSAEARALAVEGVPLRSVAGFTARYLDETGDPRAHAALEDMLARPLDGLRPGGRLQEACFSVLYLLRGGVDVRRRFPAGLRYLRAVDRSEGVGIEADSRSPDLDASAVLSNCLWRCGVAPKMPTAAFERYWSDTRGTYASDLFRGATLATSTVALLLEAQLCALDLGPEHKRRAWARAIDMLESRVWHEVYHLSPLYVWEPVISVISRFAPRFPGRPTRVHLDALEALLGTRTASGGFGSVIMDGQANLEETALAALALRAIAATPLAPALRERVRGALRQAQDWLRQAARREPSTAIPDLYLAKASFGPVNVRMALHAAALHTPVTA